MKFKPILRQNSGNKIPFNYQYPLSAVIYKIIDRADKDYAERIHKDGYGKGFKFFTFSELNFKSIKWDKEGLLVGEQEVLSLYIDWFIPKAYQNFMKGIFKDKVIDIADKSCKTSFEIISVEIVETHISQYKDNEIIKVDLLPTSPICVGRKNERGNYDYLKPDDENFTQYLLKNWKEKIKTLFPNESPPYLNIEISKAEEAKSKLVILKAGTPQETKIKGYKNFQIELVGRKKDIELFISGGLGIHNAQGMGSVKIIENNK